ncbi:MAG: reverse transcriptase domain-containing protein [Chloroflexota bacterium]|nr:reverse transcriptase domain-containing protein [Chloroflexota bacterium]
MQIAKVQESLARKALYQPNTKSDDLFNLVAHPYWLWVATECILQSSGSTTPGIDGMTRDTFKGNTHDYAQTLATDLKTGMYQSQPVKRVYVPKADGTFRSLGIPTLRDRVIQEAIRMVLEPILESHFLNCSTAFRPGRRVMDAIHRMEYFANNNVKMWWIVKGTIQRGGDSIPHRKLRGILRQYLQDKKLLHLLTSFLSTGIVEKGKIATPNEGVIQSGILSTLLVNVYFHELDKFWWSQYGSLSEIQKTARRRKGLGNVQFLRHGEDFVVMTNGEKSFAFELQDEFDQALQNLDLELSKERTQVVHLNDGFDFAGFHLQKVHSAMSNKNIVLVKPTQQSIEQFKDAARGITARETTGDDVPNKIRAMNALIRHWANYYRYSNVHDEFADMEHFLHFRLYYWLKAKHSNLSARESVKKYVVSTYLTQYNGTRKVWGMYGVKLLPMTTIKRKSYCIQWPSERNPYLEYGISQMKVTDEIPIPQLEHVWRGHSEQSAYAIARLERLEQVGHQCEECGSSEGYFHAHHVVPQREHGKHTIENLRILCEPCHIKTYSRK